jgi:N-acetylglucosamine kinase-like BadF-type ATPase
MDQEYFIGFDVGGTKTDAVLFTRDGEIIRHVITPGANPLDVGFEEACGRYLHAVNALREGLNAPIRCVYGAVACLEYFKTRATDFMKQHVPEAVVRLESDGNCLISAMIGHQDGACMICGTGSSLCFRQGEAYGHIGGWGYLVDSCGSGFVLGKKALLAIARAEDGRDGPTLMSRLFEERYGESMNSHYEKIYQGGRPYIASMAFLVFEARRAGDFAAGKIFDECIADLSELVWTGYRRFGGAYQLILNGGVFHHYPEYVQALRAHVPPQVTLIDSDAPPVYGCAVEAMYDAGYSCGPEFKKKFLSGYNRD